MWHLARKTVQTLVFLSLVAAPAMALFDVAHYTRSVYGDHTYSLAARRIRGMRTVPALFLKAQEALIGERSRNARPLSESFAGSPWAMRVGGWFIIEPLNAVGALAAGGGAWGKVLMAALPYLILAALLGRVFCGWLCPVHFLLEMTDGLRSVLARLGVPVRNFKLRRRAKFATLGLGVVATSALGAQVFPLVYPPAVFGRQMFELIYFGALGGGAVFLLAVAFAEIFLSRRLWCRYLCPGGALYSLLSPLRVISIKRAPANCDDCGDCNAACAFGLSPMTDATGIECTSCLECVRACPTDALSLHFRLAGVPSALSHAERESA